MKLMVLRIEDRGDRVLLYGEDPSYHLIALAGSKWEIGQEVEYELGGFNFGWAKL